MTASPAVDLVTALAEAGLTGRGGAGFSTATKVRAAVDHGADLIVNACDGELGAVKDAYVLDHHLSMVRRGAELAGGSQVRYAVRRGSVAHTLVTRPASMCSPSPTATCRRRRALWSPWPTAGSPGP
jgi:NADH:ubiquinone oxidoreductase subunit F (NADH-binding)